MRATVGAFGKMPSVGDFFRIDTPAGFVRVWDEWVQQGMLNAAQALGTGWDAAYMSAPIWRFTLSRGLAGPRSVLGVLMPSVDRVGRRFPLTLMTEADGAAPELHQRAAGLFEALEYIALDALEDDMTRDSLVARLAGARAPFAGDLSNASDDRSLISRWTAVLQDGRLEQTCAGLPTGAAQIALYDMTSAIWKEAHTA